MPNKIRRFIENSGPYRKIFPLPHNFVLLHFRFSPFSEHYRQVHVKYTLKWQKRQIILISSLISRHYSYTSHKNNCQKIWPAQSMITKRGFVFCSSCFCEKYISATWPINHSSQAYASYLKV